MVLPWSSLPLPRVLRALATLGPVGHIPVAPATAGSLLGLMAWMALQPPAGWVLWTALGVMALLAAAAAGAAAKALGHADPPPVVIDEVVGMALTLSLVPAGLRAALAAFAAFRILDVAKPFPIRWLERLPGGWGIVADDVGAALYAAAGLRLVWVVLGLS